MTKTVEDLVLAPLHEKWKEYQAAHNAEPIPLPLFLSFHLDKMSRLDFLHAISEAIEERVRST